MQFRAEKDTMGVVEVPVDVNWGAQTERSRKNFSIGPAASMPLAIIHALAYVKKAAAHANHTLGVLNVEKRDLISDVCDTIIAEKLDDEFCRIRRDIAHLCGFCQADAIEPFMRGQSIQ